MCVAIVYGWNVTQLTIREGTELSVQVVILKGLRTLVNVPFLTYEVRLAPGGNASTYYLTESCVADTDKVDP